MDSIRMTFYPVSLNEVQPNSLNLDISPNPLKLNSTLNLELSLNLAAQLVVTNIEGKGIYNEEVSFKKGVNKLDLTKLNITIPGIYFIKVTGETFSATRRLLVQ